MRQPKFRFWDGHQMIYNGYDHADLSFNGLLVCEGGTIPLQSTHLKDKNGVEIYEGDIFRDEFGGVWPVEWSAQYAAFVVGNGGDALFSNWKDGENLEVIGNVHENPELLEAGHE